jgi:homoserine kinase
MSAHPRSFKIRVPATSANIGPGFDVVGLSLSLYLILTVTVPDPSSASLAERPSIAYTGEGAEEVPLDAYKNLTTRVALYVLRCNGVQSFPPGLVIHVHNEIPFGRGLGSSGAAIIAGVMLGDALGQLGLSRDRMLDFALMVERHPDNVTAALIGGFVGSYLRELDPSATQAASVPLSEVLPEYPPDAGPDWGRDPPLPPVGIGHYVTFGWAEEIRAVAIIPRFELSTATARGVLPETYSRKDVVRSHSEAGAWQCLTFAYPQQIFNMQRLAVLTTALAKSPPDPDLIYEAMKDRVHQPYRRNLVCARPAFLTVN